MRFVPIYSAEEVLGPDHVSRQPIAINRVLVVAPAFIPAISQIRRALAPGGEYLAVENWTSPLLEVARLVVNRRKFSSQFSYLNPERLRLIQSVFKNVSHQFGPFRFAIGIRAS